MQAGKTSLTEMQSPSVRKSIFIAMIVLSFLAIGLSACGANNDSETSSPQSALSQSALEAQYGVRVNLLAVTAAGGLVDLRLKIVDAEKARLLLQESSDIPALLVGEDGAVLTAPEDSTGQLLNNLEDDGNIFLLYPNVGNVLKPGMSVTVQFGERYLEPIIAQ